MRYTSTSGFGLGMLKWNIDRPFVFFENGIFYKRYLSIYHALQADSPSGNPTSRGTRSRCEPKFSDGEVTAINTD